MFCCLSGLFHEGVSVPVGFAVEAEDTAVVDDAVDDRGGHVPVAEHVAPSAGLEVRGEDDAAGLVAVRDDLEQKPGPVDVDGQVAELVDDDQPGCFASMFVRQVRQCFSVVWADGFPRCRHRFPVM